MSSVQIRKAVPANSFFFFSTFCLSHQHFARQSELTFQKFHRSGKEVPGGKKVK